jgi:hypothetical protein
MSAINRDEWLQRYQQRFMKEAGVNAEQARQCSEAEPFEVLSDGFEDDPEGAADSEMSYWEP